jgi:hypothetical protein
MSSIPLPKIGKDASLEEDKIGPVRYQALDQCKDLEVPTPGSL